MRNRLHIYIDIFNLPSIGKRKFAIDTINPTGIDKRRKMYVNSGLGAIGLKFVLMIRRLAVYIYIAQPITHIF